VYDVNGLKVGVFGFEGCKVGLSLGAFDGNSLGSFDENALGSFDENALGSFDVCGSFDGECECGCGCGLYVGVFGFEGCKMGPSGAFDGNSLCSCDENALGSVLGIIDGIENGSFDDAKEGTSDEQQISPSIRIPRSKQVC